MSKRSRKKTSKGSIKVERNRGAREETGSVIRFIVHPSKKLAEWLRFKFAQTSTLQNPSKNSKVKFKNIEEVDRSRRRLVPRAWVIITTVIGKP